MSHCNRREFLAAATFPFVAPILPIEGGSPARTFPPLRSEDVEEVDVFVSGEGGYHTYRIPAVVTTSEGTLLAFCEGRKTSAADHGNNDLLLKRSGDGGRTWTQQHVVYEEGGAEEVTIGNPCPVVDEHTGTVWLSFCRNNRDVLVTKSADEGRTWSSPVDITEQVKKPDWGWYATGPGIGIQMQQGRYRGRFVIPCDHREDVDGKAVKFSHVFYSDDGGATWELGRSVAPHTDECQVAELADGRLMINMRNYWARDGGRPEQGNMRAVAYSSDGGETWSELSFDETLIEPVCQASLLRYLTPDHPQESCLLFSNPASKEERVRMTVRLSRDGGQTWPIARELDPGPSAYSCLTVLPDRRVGCLYENGEEGPYEKITLARFGLPWLMEGAPSFG